MRGQEDDGLEEDTKMSNENRYRQRLSTFAANWRALALRGLVALSVLFGTILVVLAGSDVPFLAPFIGAFAVVGLALIVFAF
jgi:hypothetical protein